MIKFEKVSLEQFVEGFAIHDRIAVFTENFEEIKLDKKALSKFAQTINKTRYDNIKLPKRATAQSAGYDFYSTDDFVLHTGETMTIYTGIRVKLPADKFLMIVPRSGLGFKYRTQLDNTVGIIDADYYNAKNEGHITIKITNDSKKGDVLTIKQGDAIAQGIIMQYFVTDDDDSTAERTGGFGSTDEVKK